MSVAIESLDFEAIAAREKAGRKSGSLKIVFAVFICAIWMVPFYYLFTSIFKTTEEYSINHPLSLPTGVAPLFANAAQAWQQGKMGAGLLNSTLYATLGAGLAVFFAAMAAYGLTRINFERKNMWFMLIFAGTVFPFQMYLIPLFFGFQKIGILNTQFGMVLVYTAICIPFPVLVLRNYMNGLSREMDEAARMDGAREFTVFWHIVLPNCRGPMAATFLLQFTWDLERSVVLHGLGEPHGGPIDHECFAGLSGELFFDGAKRCFDSNSDRECSRDLVIFPFEETFHGGNACVRCLNLEIVFWLLL